MEWVVNNWFIIVAGMAVISAIGLGIWKFISTPTAQQIVDIKEWLLWAVVNAEKELGSGTGQIKLRYVYDMFIAKFNRISKFIPFSVFSSFVDEALDKMKEILEDNDKLKHYIGIPVSRRLNK